MKSKYIVLISGKARHGKDTLADRIAKELNLARIKCSIIHFADALKSKAKLEYGWSGKKDEEGRKLLQDTGTKYRNIDKDYWVKELNKTIAKCDANVILIPDTRYRNEVDYYINNKDDYLGVIHVRVVRLAHDNTEYDNQLSLELKNHPSETELDNYGTPIIVKSASGCLGMDIIAGALAHNIEAWLDERTYQ